jgi:hypothetical protein
MCGPETRGRNGQKADIHQRKLKFKRILFLKRQDSRLHFEIAVKAACCPVNVVFVLQIWLLGSFSFHLFSEAM